jgi:1-acyl-sn-glycerol-3-phosphate acyltransferase
MFSFLPGPVKGVMTLSLISINTICWCLLLYPIALVRWLLPASQKPLFTRLMSWVANCWITCNNLFIDLTQHLEVDLDGMEGLQKSNWFLVTCNHQSWADILLLQRTFLHKIPMLKFFLKQVLIWVPVIGIAWWALDFPFMKRYSRDQLEQNPELKGKDLETTRAACRIFKTSPVSVLNFLEGTRFTPQKHEMQKSPYKRLLLPRSGGAALVLNVMQDEIDSLIDVTIAYPGSTHGFWDFLCGRIPRVIVRVREISIPERLKHGDYENDPEFKVDFQNWINQLWTDKDALLEELLQSPQ